MLDDAAYRTCPKLGVVAFLADPFDSLGRIVKLDAIDLQEASRAVELDADDLVDLFATQRGEDDGLIDTVEELGTDRLLQKAEYQLTRLVDSSLLTARGDGGEARPGEGGGGRASRWAPGRAARRSSWVDPVTGTVSRREKGLPPEIMIRDYRPV